MYGLPIVIETGDDIDDLCDFEVVYDPPPGSDFIEAVLAASPDVSNKIHDEPLSFLLAGYKYEHLVLFREALVHVVALWEEKYEWKETLKSVPVVLEAVISSYSWAVRDVTEVEVFIDKYVKDEEEIRQLRDEAWKAIFGRPKECLSKRRRAAIAPAAVPLFTPTLAQKVPYFRFIYEKLQKPGMEFYQDLAEDLEVILGSKLVLDKSRVSGVGNCKNRILCASLEDQFMPWTNL